MSAAQSSALYISLIRTKDLSLSMGHYAYPYFLPFTTRHLINKHNFLSITQFISLKHLEDIEKNLCGKNLIHFKIRRYIKFLPIPYSILRMEMY